LPIHDDYLSALRKLFRTKPVVVLNDLRRALGTTSRTTIFRVLLSVGYRSSYSHAGRYYTLKDTPKFDSQGIWLYRDVGFSSHGTLRDTVIYLVEQSPEGQTHDELQELLQLRVHDTLRLLVDAQALRRERFQDVYVYLSAKPKVASAQWTKRQQRVAAAPSTAKAKLEPSRIIEVLVDVIGNPQDDAGAIARRLGASGHHGTIEQVEAIFARYELKKTVRSRTTLATFRSPDFREFRMSRF
jgi:hypothetical protein